MELESSSRSVNSDKNSWPVLESDQSGILQFYNVGDGYGFIISKTVNFNSLQ